MQHNNSTYLGVEAADADVLLACRLLRLGQACCAVNAHDQVASRLQPEQSERTSCQQCCSDVERAAQLPSMHNMQDVRHVCSRALALPHQPPN